MAAGLLSIIGPPAAGKTTTAEWLAEALPARLIREDYAGNPFLGEAYEGQRQQALACQLYFLFSRLRQLNLAAWPEADLAVSDYGFCQDGIFAAGGLSGADLAVYRGLAGPAGERVKRPDLLIHLDGGAELLLERIARRGRPYERRFTDAFIERLRRAYRHAAAGAECPVIAVDVGAVDLRAQPARSRLLRQIRERLP